MPSTAGTPGRKGVTFAPSTKKAATAGSSASSSGSGSGSSEEEEDDSSEEEDDEQPVASSSGTRETEAPVPNQPIVYKVPSGWGPPSPVKQTSGSKTWDHDAIAQDDELQMWAIRLPTGVKISDLANLTFDLPATNELPAKVAQVKSTQKKRQIVSDLSLYPTGNASGSSKRSKADLTPAGELASLAMFTRSQKTGIHRVPITHTMALTRSLPSSVLSHLPSANSSLIHSQAPSPIPAAPGKGMPAKPKRPQPKSLAYRLAAWGSEGGVTDADRGRYVIPPIVKEETEELAEEEKPVVEDGEMDVSQQVLDVTIEGPSRSSEDSDDEMEVEGLLLSQSQSQSQTAPAPAAPVAEVQDPPKKKRGRPPKNKTADGKPAPKAAKEKKAKEAKGKK